MIAWSKANHYAEPPLIPKASATGKGESPLLSLPELSAALSHVDFKARVKALLINEAGREAFLNEPGGEAFIHKAGVLKVGQWEVRYSDLTPEERKAYEADGLRGLRLRSQMEQRIAKEAAGVLIFDEVRIHI